MKSLQPLSVIFMLMFTLCMSIAGTLPGTYKNTGEIMARAKQLHDSGYYKAAIGLMNYVPKSDPNYPWICYEMALSYYSAGDNAAALAKCREADFLRYDHPYTYSLMGSIMDDMGNPDEGVKILSKAHKKWPFNQNVIYNLGLCYLNSGKPDSAESVLQQNVILYPYHTRSHLALAKANYAMGRMAEAYLAYNMAILLNPNMANVKELEYALSGKLQIIPRAYLYPYPSDRDHKNWDYLTALLQSEIVFNKNLKFPYDLDFTFTRQSYILFRNLAYNRQDTSVYSRFYSRLFQEMMESDEFEVYINYCMKNIGSQIASQWLEKDTARLSLFINHARNFLDQGKASGFYTDYAEKGIRIHHYNDDGDLKAIGEDFGNDETRNGNWIVINQEGYIEESGKYVNGLIEGKWLLYWPDGTMKQDLEISNDKLNGICITYFPDGSKEGVYNFNAGLKNGRQEEFTSSGRLLNSYEYNNGILNGPAALNNYSEGFSREFQYRSDTLQGKFTEKWLNGKIKTEAANNNGKLDGPYHAWYPNGNPESELIYSKGMKTGKYTNYNSNATLSSTGEYDMEGKLTGETRLFDHNGVLMSVEKVYQGGILNGDYSDYFPNGKVQVKRSYVNDSLKAIESFDEQGKILYNDEVNNDSVYFKSYYGDGILFQEGLLINGKNYGSWRKYNPVGTLIEDRTYLSGLLHGPQKIYFPTGAIHEEYNCDSNNISGIYRTYYRNGHLQAQGNYVKEGIDGEWINYYSNDTVNTRAFYEKGTLIGRYMVYSPDGRILSEEFYNNQGISYRSILYDIDGKADADWNFEYGTHTFTRKFLNGQTQSVTRISDNQKHGLLEKYFPNGQLAEQVNFLYGNPDGSLKRWDYKGNMTLDFSYLFGKPDGISKWYNEGINDYVVTYENGINQGKIFDYYNNGKLSREIDIVNDEKNGFTDYYSFEGTFMYRIRYVNDIIKGYTWKDKNGNFVPEVKVNAATKEIVAYYPNGKIAVKNGIRKGTLEGGSFSYYPTGVLQRELFFKDGEYTGVEKRYYPDGKIMEMTSFVNNEREGPYQLNFNNGSIKKKGNYTNGKEHGEWRVYNIQGKLTETLLYYHGNLYEIAEN